MNTTFNLKRFFLLEKYKKQETGKHLLWSAGVVLGICILCMMYDINKGMSYYTEHTQANYFCRYILWYICIAPCLLEPSMTIDKELKRHHRKGILVSITEGTSW